MYINRGILSSKNANHSFYERQEKLNPLLCKQVKWASILLFKYYLRGFFTMSVENSARLPPSEAIKCQGGDV